MTDNETRVPLCRECDNPAEYKVQIHPSGAAYRVYCEEHLPEGDNIETPDSVRETGP